jgi:hypothetical protein
MSKKDVLQVKGSSAGIVIELFDFSFIEITAKNKIKFNNSLTIPALIFL